MSATFIKNSTPVTAIYLANNIDLSIKVNNYPLKCKIAKIKSMLESTVKW